MLDFGPLASSALASQDINRFFLSGAVTAAPAVVSFTSLGITLGVAQVAAGEALISNSTFTQRHAFAAVAITGQQPSALSVVLSERDTFTPTNAVVSGAALVGSAALAQKHKLNPSTVSASSGVVSVSAIGQSHRLPSVSIDSRAIVLGGNITFNHVLVGAAVSGAAPASISVLYNPSMRRSARPGGSVNIARPVSGSSNFARPT